MSKEPELFLRRAPELRTLAPSSWTRGQKRLILIRVDFADLSGAPFPDSTATNLVNGVNSFYTENSYAQTSFGLLGAGSALTPTLRLPQRADYYGTNNLFNQMRSDARTAAAVVGYVLSDYDFDIICFGPVPGVTWSGLGNVGTNGVWLRNSFNAGVASHELGHNFGLNHANSWETGGQSVIGPGSSTEQGDQFDTMGFAFAGNNHFNARYKALLDWIPTNAVLAATSNRTYRIYAHDDTNSTGARALMIPRTGGTNYWLEFRQKFTSNKWLMSGAGLRWAQAGNQKSLLLDTTAGSADAKNDAAIVIGRTFSDRQAGIHITAIGKGGTSPESLDLVVNLGNSPTNVDPTVTIFASVTNAAAGGVLNFTASATDANGDALAYYWDFGDGNFGTNGPAATKSWSATGEYVVRCLVSDMRGGLAAGSRIVQIGSPATLRISGRATVDANPLANARIYVSPTKMAFTDSDGTYSIVGLNAGSYTVAASLYGYSIGPSGFTNPVTIGPSPTNIDFVATNLLAPPPFRFRSPAVRSNNFEVILAGAMRQKYQIEASANFTQWTPVTKVTNVTGEVQFVDPDTALFSRRFYRSYLVPE